MVRIHSGLPSLLAEFQARPFAPTVSSTHSRQNYGSSSNWSGRRNFQQDTPRKVSFKFREHFVVELERGCKNSKLVNGNSKLFLKTDNHLLSLPIACDGCQDAALFLEAKVIVER